MSGRRYIGAMILAVVACSGDKNAAKNDPDRPAVVQAPPIILPSDTAKPDTMPAYQEKIERAQRELTNEYAVLATASIMGDRATVASFYTNDAVLKLGDSTYTGQANIATALTGLMRRSSVKELVRASAKLTAIDTVYADSGIYGILAQRPGGQQVEERGIYAAEWVFGGNPKRWAMRRDAISSTKPVTKPR